MGNPALSERRQKSWYGRLDDLADVFTASCDIEPTGCAFAWLLLLLSVMVHAMYYCGGDECESDKDGPSTMYS